MGTNMMNAHVEKTLEYFQSRGGETPPEIREKIDDPTIPPCRLFLFLRGREDHAGLWVLLWELRGAAWDYTWFSWRAVQALTAWENSRWEICWMLWGMLRD